MRLYIICGILAAIIIFLIIRLFMYKSQVNSMSEQIRKIRKNNSNIYVTSIIRNREFEELLFEVNSLLKDHRLKEEESIRSSNQLKDALTYISHDIRTPLTSLSGYFELLKEAYDEESKLKYTGIIEERINVLKDMLEQLFEYLKMQNESYALEINKENISEIVTKAVVSFYEEINNKNIEPVIDIEEGVWSSVNKAGFYRVVENVLRNALIHGKDYLAIKLEKRAENIVLMIENNCENIDEIVVENVFDRFYKADKARTQISSGLGLAIAKDMIEKMNGKIKAEVKENIFTIKIIIEKD